MSIVQVHNVKKAFGADEVLGGVSFQLQKKERVGLVGPNGAGKTTLLNIMAGLETADEGTVTYAKGTTLAYLEQQADVTSSGSMEEELRKAFAGLEKLAETLRTYEKQMADGKLPPDELAAVMAAYGEARQLFEAAEGYNAEARLRAVVNGLGFTEKDLNRPVSSFSGGERTRLRLARLLLEQPDILLLDEPTNHLDLAAVEWLEKFLAAWPGTILLVSHDRYFLDRVVERILALENGQVKSYTGNYSAYLQQKELERVALEKSYQKQQLYLEKETAYIRSLGTSEREKRQAKSRQKRLAKIQPVEKPLKEKKMVLDFNYAGRSGDIVARLEQVSKSFGTHKVLSNASFEIRFGDRIGLVGPNGAGKSTLLKLLAGELSPDSGRIWLGPSVCPVYFDQHQQVLDPQKTPLEEILAACDMTATEARTYLGRFLFSGDDVFKRNETLSGGERSRLALAKLSLDAGNFLMLDEPTNHLDILGMEELEAALLAFPGTLLVVSHDRYFLSRTTNKILDISAGRIRLFPLPYAEYLAERDREAQTRPDIAEAEKRMRREEETRRRAEELARRRRRRKLQDALAQAEEEIAACEATVRLLEKELSAPEVFSDYRKAAAKGEAMAEAKKKLSALYERWDSLAEQLEE
ncbi:MAG: ABC-F family ATP-binding cassette domain-containing protein [Firmicutes bacterium]|nr:ABC-F family ATP-binding cassette domain-containing protein [Bacillota bacterium]